MHDASEIAIYWDRVRTLAGKGSGEAACMQCSDTECREQKGLNSCYASVRTKLGSCRLLLRDCLNAVRIIHR